MLTSIPVSTLTSGVSQQPPTLRTASAAEKMDNGWPSVVFGQNKRQPTEHLAKTNLKTGIGIMGHIIDRDDPNYRYMVTVSNQSLQVFDLNGKLQTVNVIGDTSYLTQTVDADAFRFLTVGDYTFILNRDVVVQPDDFGELTTADYTPNGEVLTAAKLPAAALYNTVYYVTSEDAYYKYVHQDAVTAGPQWTPMADWFNNADPQDPASGIAPTDYPIVNALPATGNVGDFVYLVRPTLITINNYTMDTATVNYYRLYKVTSMATATPAQDYWQKVTLADLVSSLNNNRLNPSTRGTVYITNSDPNAYYSVYLNNNLKATFLTKNGTDAADSVESTTVIAQSIATALVASGLSATTVGSTVVITGLAESDVLAVTSSEGDKSIKCYKDEVKSFSDLPPNEVVGRVVKVKGDPKTAGDDYYVVWDGSLWNETYGWNQGGGIKKATMPHVLIHNADGTFTLSSRFYSNRPCGDKVSNPHPSFVGQTLSDMFLYGDRLCFVSNENIIMSEVGHFENYYRSTLVTQVDSDLIDIAVFSPNVNTLHHVVPFNHDLLIFADRMQYRLTYQTSLGPKNLQVNFTTAFNCGKSAKPINVGSTVYFIDDRDTYTYAKVFEYFPRVNNMYQLDDAEESTSPLPQYIPSGVHFMSASSRIKAVVVGTTGDPTKLYIHKYFWDGEKKIQNAWGTWSFDDCTAIRWAGFSQNYLYLLVERNGAIQFERLLMDENAYDLNLGSRVLLDRLVSVPSTAMAYDPIKELTMITMPYQTSAPVEVCSTPANDSVDWARHRVVARTLDTTIQIKGDLTKESQVYMGIPYVHEYKFSTPYMRMQHGSGEIIDMDGRLQMKYLTIEYHNAAHFKVGLTIAGRLEYFQSYEGKLVSSNDAKWGSVSQHSGTYRVSLGGKNTDVQVRILNDTPFAAAFGSAQWFAQYAPKSKKA